MLGATMEITLMTTNADQIATTTPDRADTAGSNDAIMANLQAVLDDLLLKPARARLRAAIAACLQELEETEIPSCPEPNADAGMDAAMQHFDASAADVLRTIKAEMPSLFRSLLSADRAAADRARDTIALYSKTLLLLDGLLRCVISAIEPTNAQATGR
jgi:hypothetical protein